MNPTQLYTLSELAAAYRVHRSTIVRRMREIGIEGHKIGPKPKAPRRFDRLQVQKLEVVLGFKLGGPRESR